jgi:CSLREA domain-containing protein
VAIGSSSSGCELDTVGPGDTTAAVDPLLARLADNGGPTMTHAPLDGSPAVDAGDPSTPGSSEAACAPTDQRGVTRPQGSVCDIGAYEAVQEGGALAVTKTQDSNDGVCDADCSLREAIAVANGRFGQDVITVPAGNFVFTLGPQGFTALVLSGDLIINGAGAEQTILDGFQFTRVLRVDEGYTVRISDLTVRNGFGQDGGAIANQGSLTLERVVVSDSQSISGRGGGIENLGTLTVLDSTITRNAMGGGGSGGGIHSSGALTVMSSTISFNSVTRGGGGGGVSGAGTFIDCTISDNVVSDDDGSFGGKGGGFDGGPLTIVDSTIRNNSASDGGGISCGAGLTLTNVTINDNVAGGTDRDFGSGFGGQGGGIYCLGAMTLKNVTISNNIAQDRDGSQGEGGGIYGSETGTIFNNVTITANTASLGGGIASGGPTLSNTLIAGNNGGNCFDFIGSSLGHNFVAIGEEEFDCFLDGAGAGDITADIDPGLGPLADNGGPTMTHALVDGSPAINGGDASAPGSGDGACEATDQRGVARPRQGRCDIGAFESDLLPPAGIICATASEGGLATLQCPEGVVLEIQFASYGTPSGTCGQFSTGGCHAVNSSDVVLAQCAGLSNCSIPASNDLFGDPCFGEGKSLYVQAQCGTSGKPTPTLTPTQLSNGAGCTDPQRCTSGNCVNGICCTVTACAVDEFCAPLTGECTSGPTPTPTPTNPPTPTATRVTTDERSQTDPTGWWWTTGATAQQVGDLLGQHEARLVNIEVESVSPLLFTAVMVANQGAYGKEWYWYFGVSEAQLNELSSGRRIIDLETYESGGQRLFAAVLVANTGSEEKEWGWYYDVAAGGVDDLSEAQGFRIVDLETYLAAGQLRFAFTMVKNLGADEQGWRWDHGSSAAEIESLADTGRFIDLENDPQGGYSTVTVDCPCPRWWYYTGLTEGDVNALAAENGARPIAIEPYTVPALGKRFNVIMLDNTAPGAPTTAATSSGTGQVTGRPGR